MFNHHGYILTTHHVEIMAFALNLSKDFESIGDKLIMF